ncbi:hypothetical protein [Alcanivorax sp.]|uniref:hypothetical protein n=1 Tax=Alcanivorax sp. TaxID=1872427 RepID=UPI000C0E52AD|nr:hypothetical protein [Alcanivorax sp.]PHR68482.1 MAG: hypothetical protein COA55_00240 [Alcanivorax sp.]
MKIEGEGNRVALGDYYERCHITQYFIQGCTPCLVTAPELNRLRTSEEAVLRRLRWALLRTPACKWMFASVGAYLGMLLWDIAQRVMGADAALPLLAYSLCLITLGIAASRLAGSIKVAAEIRKESQARIMEIDKALFLQRIK